MPYKKYALPAALSLALFAGGGCQELTKKPEDSKAKLSEKWQAARAGVQYSLAKQEYDAGDVDGARKNVTDEVIDSALRYRVQGPMIDSLMKEIGIEGSSLGRMSDVVRDAKDLTSIRRDSAKLPAREEPKESETGKDDD